MAAGGEEGGIIQAGRLLAEGGDLVEQGTVFLEQAGKKLRLSGEALKGREGGPLIAASGNDIERGARHILDHLDPIGEGWFRISTGGMNLQRACDMITPSATTTYRDQMKDAGMQITIAGTNILEAKDRFTQAGLLIQEVGKAFNDKGNTTGQQGWIRVGAMIQNSGELFVQGGKLIEEGNHIIETVKFIMNSQGPLIIENGEWLREGDTIIHVPKPAEVPLGDKFPTIEPLLPDLPDIAQKLPDPKDPSTYAHNWDYIDFAWNDENNLDEFNILGELNSGAYGTVHTARRKSDNELVAIKKVYLPKQAEKRRLYLIKREKRAGKMLKHHNLCNLISAFNIGDWCHFIMEYCTNGDFHEQLCRDNGFTVEVIRFYTGELIMALKYMYGQGFVHRDLKPENLMLDYRLHLKVVDFGLSKHIDDYPGCCEESQLTQPHMHKVGTFAGTLGYCAPEITSHYIYQTTFSSDMYSLGCVLFVFYTGKVPFEPVRGAYTEAKCLDDIRQGRHRKMPAGSNPHLIDLYEKLMKIRVEDRLGYNSGYDEIIEHPFYEVLYTQMNFDTLINMNPPPFKSPPPSANPANPSGDQLVVPPSSSQAQSRARSAYVASPVSSFDVISTPTPTESWSKYMSHSPVASSGGSDPRGSGSVPNLTKVFAHLINSKTTPANLFTPASLYGSDATPDTSGHVLQAPGSPRTPHRPRVTPEGGRVLEFAPPSDTPGVLPGPGGPPPSSTPQPAPTPTRGWTRNADGASSPAPHPFETTHYGAITRQPDSRTPVIRSQRITVEPEAPSCLDCLRMCHKNPNTGSE